MTTLIRWARAPFLVVVAVLCTSSSDGPYAFASVIDPSLAAIMSTAPQDTLISVVIRPLGSIGSSLLKSDILARFPTRAEQHREIISALRKSAGESQKHVLDALKSPGFSDVTQDVKNYWIDNVVTARMGVQAITELADQSDIESIRLLPDVSLVTPLSAGTTEGATLGTTPSHVRVIKADSLWLAGYTGKGRLVGSIDTGVHGKHSALTNKWRGHNGGSLAESWHDPIHADTVPHPFTGPGTNHGTQVMGLMVAVIPSGLDTIGVCPDCEWISAAAIDIPCPTNSFAPCGNLFDALQWIADPDGDPNTEWDAPDAVANPWGAKTVEDFGGCNPTQVGCSDIFWNAVANIEAAGTMMVFAAGNEGACGPMSIRNPANHATSETSAFSVGMVDARFDMVNPPIDPLSSRGPSDCDGTSIKPEVTAPGVNLRTTTTSGGTTNSAYGTSFAAPLVAAGAALLREYNPNATVDQIKSALLASAKDLGTIGPDNEYGHGLVDLMGALRNLPPNTQPAVYVKADNYIPPSPGTGTELTLTLRNCGSPATGLAVTLSAIDGRLQILDGQASFPDILSYGDSSSNESDPFHVSVDASCLAGERLLMQIAINADGGYSRVINGAIFVGPSGDAGVFTHDAGRFKMSVGATGSFGHSIDGLEPRPGGVGYLYDTDTTRSLFEGAFLIATDASHISGHVRNESGTPGVDFRLDPGGRITATEPGSLATEESRSAFDDSQAEIPIGVFIEQRTFVSDVDEHSDYLIIEYSLHNRSGMLINDLYCGIFCDWDFPWTSNNQAQPIAGRDGGGFDPAIELGWMRHRDENRFRALCVLSSSQLSGYRYFSNSEQIYDGFTKLEKWDAMTGGTAHALPTADGDGSHLVATGPIDIGPEASERVAFAMIGGTSEHQIKEAALAARAAYAAMRNELTIDLMPGVCPNVVSVAHPNDLERPRSAKAAPDRSEIDVAILGRTDADVTALDRSSVTLHGVPPIRSRFADVGTPLLSRESGDCECPISISDGLIDLVLSYDRAEVIAAFGGTPGNYTVSVRAADVDKTLRTGGECLQVTWEELLQPIPRASFVKSSLRLTGPNPFNASTSIGVSIAEDSHATLEIFDILGRHVSTLIDNQIPAGEHTVVWDARDGSGSAVASGVYIATLKVGDESQSRKLVLLK